MPSIVSISGTSRPGNYTSHALAIVNDELKARGVPPTVLDARELDLSFPGRPQSEDSQRLKGEVEAATAVILATPEYHGGFAAVTKLIIENLGFPSALSGKPVALLGVAGGRIGAIKSLEQLRGICSHAGAIVLPGSVSIAGVRAAFDQEGHCVDAGVEKMLRGLAGSLLDFLKDYVCPKYNLEAVVRGETAPWSATL